MNGIIFLDIDGVLNCQLHYSSQQYKDYMELDPKTNHDNHCLSQLSKERIEWLNELCSEMDLSVVVSSTWRMGKSVDELQRILNLAGATFTVIDKTGLDSDRFRGNEIHKWIQDNSMKIFGQPYHIFRRYVILDDDSDMLYWQRENLFICDSYAGLTPNTCYKIKNFFKSFEPISL